MIERATAEAIRKKKYKPLETIPFNKWSRERIAQGRKICTSRTREWNDPRVKVKIWLPLWVVKRYLWKEEGADSAIGFERVWRSIFRGVFDGDRMVCVHFGDFK